jgi:hypothetical protein
MWDEMYDMAVSTASPSWEVFAERPSSSIMTGRGIMMVQRRLSMSEEIIDKDERSIYNKYCVSGDDR